MHIYNSRAVNSGFVAVSAKYQELFGINISPPIISGLSIDIPRYIQSPFSITGDTAQEKAFTKIQGLNTSYFEHAIWESFTGIDSVSTVKLLQLANEAGQPIYTINSANLSQTLPLLNQSQYVKEDIQNVVAAGKEVTIPGSAITRNEWQGTGYMVRNPETGEGAYMISSGLAGGSTSSSPTSGSWPRSGALALLERKYAVLATGKPVIDFSPDGLPDWAGFGLDELITYYISLRLLIVGFNIKQELTWTTDEFKSLVNNERNYIVYYSGHGSSSERAKAACGGVALLVGWNSNRGPEYVCASDINTNAPIVLPRQINI